MCYEATIICSWTLLSIPHLKYKQKQMKKCRIRILKVLKQSWIISYKSFKEEYFVKKNY